MHWPSERLSQLLLPAAACCCLQGAMDQQLLQDAGLPSMMASYLQVWEGAAGLSTLPDLELLASLELFRQVSLVSGIPTRV